MEPMKAWLYDSASGGLEKNLYLPTEGVPKPRITSPNQVLVEVLTVALNPADYKIPEMGILSKPLITSMPATPGMDFAGRVVDYGAAVNDFKKGELVFGALQMPCKHGSLAQYVVVPVTAILSLPDSISIDQGATAGVAGMTAYQSVVPYVKAGDRVFINGGSGGTGTYGIQIAKAVGCHVTTSCSAANSQLCKRLGADETIDYNDVDIVEHLKAQGQVFSLIVDNVGCPANLYKDSHSYLVPFGIFIQVGMGTSFGSSITFVKNLLLPGFLGGGKRKYRALIKRYPEDLHGLRELMASGRVEPVIDSVFGFEEVPKAFERLKKGRAKGKIIVHVSHP
jgi:NADPH:quinone reductase-like Zn-dependent oxidoreductase